MSEFNEEMLYKAFDAAKNKELYKISGKASPLTPYKFDMNLSKLATKLIQDTGRFCENYASDLLLTWTNIERAISIYETPKSIFCVGIKSDGIDENAAILNAIKSPKARYKYRKLYAIVIDHNELTATVTMRDISSSLFANMPKTN